MLRDSQDGVRLGNPRHKSHQRTEVGSRYKGCLVPGEWGERGAMVSRPSKLPTRPAIGHLEMDPNSAVCCALQSLSHHPDGQGDENQGAVARPASTFAEVL